MNYKWVYKETKEKDCLKQLMFNRNLDESFINTDWNNLPEFSRIKDIEKAASFIIEYIKMNKKIMIYGHDDLDGITSTYILADFFKQLMYDNFDYYIPNRLIENHGLQDTFIEKVLDFDTDLVVTVDGGISSMEAIDKLKNHGVEVIVTDHHLIPQELPNAYALVNPKFKDSDYPYEMLAGVGVTYGLIQVIAEKLRINPKKSFLIWTVLGSIADKVPLTSVNRIMAKEVFKEEYILNNEDENLYFLRKNFEQNNNFSIYKFLLYIMGLFSNGRKEKGRHCATDFLFAPFANKTRYFNHLVKEKEESDIRYKRLIDFLYNEKPYESRTHIIFNDKKDKIPYSLMGKAASYYANIYRVPVLVYKKVDNQIICEARGVEGFNFVEAFDYCSDILTQYGGHARAAGFYLEPEKLSDFLEKYHQYIQQQEELILDNKKIDIDISLDLTQLNSECINKLRIFEPFGKGNPKPIFLVKNTSLSFLESKLNIESIFKNINKNGIYNFVLKWKSNLNYRVLDYRK